MENKEPALAWSDTTGLLVIHSQATTSVSCHACRHDITGPAVSRLPLCGGLVLLSDGAFVAVCLHLAKVQQCGILERNSALSATVIDIGKLDPVGQLAGLHGPTDMVVFNA